MIASSPITCFHSDGSEKGHDASSFLNLTLSYTLTKGRNRAKIIDGKDFEKWESTAISTGKTLQCEQRCTSVMKKKENHRRMRNDCQCIKLRRPGSRVQTGFHWQVPELQVEILTFPPRYPQLMLS
jgi:hypothetical protein